MGKLRRIVSITAAAIFCLLCLTMSTGLSASSSDDTVDFVLLLDCTDSMVNSDTANICEAAAKMFTDLAPSNNARVAVVAFGNTWTPEYTFGSSEMSYMNDVMGRYARTRVCMTYDMVELGSSEERRSVKQAIHDRMNEDKFSHTNTYIGGGLMTALDVLFSSKSDDAALILMSDGRLSGFDTTDGVEWKRTNRELVYDAIDIAASKKWRIYSVELNDDGKNKPSSAAKQLFGDLSSRTGAESREITESDMSQLVTGFIDIFGKFMNTDAELIEKRITNGSCAFDLNIPEVTSETNIVITGGNISSITVDGQEYSSDTYNDKVYFVKNQDGHYTLLKLFAPESGKRSLIVKGEDGADIQVQTISTRDLPVGLTFSESSPMIRNTTVEINAFLANPESGDPVRADSFYKSNKARLTVTNKSTGKSVELDSEVSDSGYKAVYDFKTPGEYEITANISSDVLRGGGKSYSRTIVVENYKMETALDGHKNKDALALDEIVTVNAYFTGPTGKLTGDLYKDGEAELEIIRDGVSMASGLKMRASEEGYSYDHTLTETGNYIFRVTSSAACFAGEPDRMTKDSEKFSCGDHSLSVNWKYSSKNTKDAELHDGAALSKSDIITAEVEMLAGDGKRVRRSRLFSDGMASLILSRDGETVDSVGLSVDDSGERLVGEWRIRKSGKITATVKLNDRSGSSDSVGFDVTNHAPELIKDLPEIKCHVGEELEIPLADHISDKDGDILEITSTVESGEPGSEFGWKVSDDASKLIIKAGGHSAKMKLIFTADDGDESVSLPASFNIVNRKPEKTANIDVPHFVVNVPGFMFFVKYDHEPVSYRLDDYFADPDGLPLEYRLDPKSELATLKDGVLSIDPAKIVSEKLKLSVTDSSEETIKVDLDLTVDDWWTLNIKRLLIVVGIALAVIILITLIVRHESNIGYLRVTSATKGGEPLELNQVLNKKRISAYSIGISKFIRNRVIESDRIQAVNTDKGRIIGHLIFGNSVTVKGSNANSVFLGDGMAVSGKKIKLKPGNSITLRYDDIQITIHNDN